MKEKLPSEGDIRQDGLSYCEKFERLPFPTGAFNPPQKDEYVKRLCNKKCMECPFFGWPMPGPAGRDGKDGRDGVDGQQGRDGINGTDGITPIIGDNGNWWIDIIDTGIPARGPEGQAGAAGPQGIQGATGDTGPQGQQGVQGVTGDTGPQGQQGVQGATGDTGPQGIQGIQGPPGTFDASLIYAWKSDTQTLSPAPTTGVRGDAVAFTNSTTHGTALSLTSPTEIGILESGIYSIRWEVNKSGYDSAFALFLHMDDGMGPNMLPGSNYGALSHDEKYSGQVITDLIEGGTITLNRIDTLYPLKILNHISDGMPTIGASITIIKVV